MVTFVAGYYLNMASVLLDADLSGAHHLTQGSKHFLLEDYHGSRLKLDGEGFKYAHLPDLTKTPLSGEVHSIAYSYQAQFEYRISGLDLDYSKVVAANDTFSTADNHKLFRSLLSGNDTVIGAHGGELLFGYNGDDHIDGGAGNDRLYGGNGDDFLDGGRGDGNDFLFGGRGSDTFAYGSKTGTDTVADFHAAGPHHDKIDLSHFELAHSFAELKEFFDKHGTDVWIDASQYDHLVIKRVGVQDLHSSDFIFG